MIGAAKRKSTFPAGFAALRLVLLLVVALCLPETRVWGFAATPQPASGVFAPANPLSIGENYDGWQYDASDSSLAARGTTQLALPAPKVVPRDPFHHIFPQRADLAAEFKARGINPHEFTMQVPKPLHQQIHSGGPRGGQWNQAWDDYFKANPSATATDVYKEAGRLIYQFDVPGGPVVPYPR